MKIVSDQGPGLWERDIHLGSVMKINQQSRGEYLVKRGLIRGLSIEECKSKEIFPKIRGIFDNRRPVMTSEDQ